MPAISNLSRGLNLWGLASGVNMFPGEAQDLRDILFRGDGAIFKHWGWRRVNPTALGARIVGVKGFSYKGKNNNTAVNTGRPGNFGVGDDAAIFTRRGTFYTSGIVLTTAECRMWNPVTEAFDLIALPAGVTVNVNPKPSFLVLQNNVYITGWATANLRYDPVDRALYEWGWENLPANAGHTGVGAGGTLVANATYQYRLAWIDMYTGEESGLGVAYSATTTTANRTVTLDNFVDYGAAGLRHFVDPGAEPTNEDVGIVVYRTGPDQDTFHFLALVAPDVTTATVTDNGLVTDASLKADVRTYQDPPRFTTITEFRNQWWGISWEIPPTGGGAPGATQPTLVSNPARVYHNDFRGERSFFERWDVRNYREIPLQHGEVLTAVARTDHEVIVFSSYSGYILKTVPMRNRVDITVRPTQWPIGCVAPKAWAYHDNYLYWLSDRGPYRWRGAGNELEWIGKNLLPMFIDPTSGVCKLNESGRLESEVIYDKDADMLRFIFPCGNEALPNRHLMYWLKARISNGDPTTGWSLASSDAQSLDYSNVFVGDDGGVPVTPFERRGRLLFSDRNGYLLEYDPSLERAELPVGELASGPGVAGGDVLLLVTAGGLYTTGNGLANMRLEVVYADGSIDVRTIASNTATNVVPTMAFSQVPDATSTWYLGGIPSYWRSWVEHGGDPAAHKTFLHLWLGYDRDSTLPGMLLDLSIASGDFPTAVGRSLTVDLSEYRAQALVSLTGRYFNWEVANSRPDEPFMITYFDPEFVPLAKRRL